MPETTRLLRDLVSLPSVNPMGQAVLGDEFFEYQVTDFLENFFRELGVPYCRQTVAPRRDNIVAEFECSPTKPTVLFEVHQDTVPVDNMTVDPFGAVIDGGRLYGRGACDVKGGMAAMLAAFARLVRQKPTHRKNVIMACTVDEEHTTLGVKKLIAEGVRADMALVAEPTQMKIVNAHKGTVRWHLTTSGRACHSSRPEQGTNAIYRMGRILVGIEQLADQLQSGRSDPLLGPPTLSVGRIEGGSSVNTVPDSCRIDIDRRVIPGEDSQRVPQQLIDHLRTHAGIDFPFTCNSPWVCSPALGPELSARLVTELGQVLDEVQGRHQVIAVPYGTDASWLARAGVPSVVVGPGDAAQAHTCDECIDLSAVEVASEVYYRFASRD